MFSVIHTAFRTDSKSSNNEKHLIKIFASIDSNNLEEFKNNLKNSPKNVLICQFDGQLAVHRAVQLNRVEILQAILESSQTVFSNFKCKNAGETIWHLAVKSKNSSILNILFEKCQATSEINKQKESVLDLVIRSDNLEYIKRFIDYGFKKVNLFEATANTKVFALLLSNIKSLNIFKLNERGQSLLHSACRKKNIALARSLIADGFNVNQMDHDGRTPVHMAIKSRDLNLIIFLINNEAHLKVTKKLWEYKAKFLPVIHEAIDYDDSAVISYLISHGADLNAQDPSGMNAIALAIKRKLSDDILMQLIEGGSNPTLPDKSGRTPLQTLKDNNKLISFIYKTTKDKEKIFDLPEISIQHPEYDCPICKELINESDQMYALTCKHNYHKTCIDYWFENSVYCPQCNEKILKIK